MAFAIAPSPVVAQDRKTVRVVVGFPASSISDIVARLIAPDLGLALGRNAIVDVKAGADGQIAAQDVMRQPPDGSTLFVATNSPLQAVPAMRQPPPYDPVADFSHIGYIGRYVHFLLVAQDTPFGNVAELLAYARANPGMLNIANGATFQKVATAQLLSDTQTQMNEVNYKGEPAALTDLVAGRVQVMICSQGVALEFLKEKRVRALAVNATRRSPYAPDIPTLQEVGLKPFEVVPWVALIGPPGMPVELIEQLNRALRKTMARADIKEQLERIGIEPGVSSAAELRQMVIDQLKVWQRNVKALGLAS
ncbi:MAG: tripartite tricarboxylate transporter substrate binding protein [Burkholderiales bacterium]